MPHRADVEPAAELRLRQVARRSGSSRVALGRGAGRSVSGAGGYPGTGCRNCRTSILRGKSRWHRAGSLCRRRRLDTDSHRRSGGVHVMRRTGRHAVKATFEPAGDRVRAVLAQGTPLSSAARLVGRDDPGPVSLLLEACGSGGYDGLVRAELLVHPERTGALLAGVEFELLAGRRLLGCGKILRDTERLDSSMQHGRGRGVNQCMARFRISEPTRRHRVLRWNLGEKQCAKETTGRLGSGSLRGK